MFNDDVLSKCQQCGSYNTAESNKDITCRGCGFGESLVLDDKAHEGVQKRQKTRLCWPRLEC